MNIKSKILAKVDNILNCFTATEPTWTATQLARKLDIPVSTLHGILSDLVAMDFLMQYPQSKEYRIGLRYMEMGFLHANNSQLNNIAHAVMLQLTSDLGHMIGLSVVYKGWMYVAASVLPAQTIRGLRYQGPRMPAHMSAGGKSILAYLSEQEIEKYCHLAWEPNINMVPCSLNELTKELIAIRNQGYSLGFSLVNPDKSTSIGAPVMGRHNQVLASLVVISPDGFSEHEFKTISYHLMTAANEISIRSCHLSPPESYI